MVERSGKTERIEKVELREDLEVSLPPMIIDEGTGNTLCLFGSSKCGKTTLWTSIFHRMYNNSKYISTLFAGNPQLDEYKGMDKYLLITNGFNKLHEQYLASQHYINTQTKNKYNFLAIFDDQLDLRFSKILNKLLLSWRNSNMSTIICLQAVKILTPQSRSNLNNVILMWFNNEEAIEAALTIYLKEYFRRMKISKDRWVNYYREMTRDHGYFYLHILSETLWSNKKGFLIKEGVAA